MHTIPADGWRAVYVREIEGVPPELHSVPLICFSVIEDLDTGEEQMVGMIAEGPQIVPCLSPTFLGYLPRDARLDSMTEELQAWIKEQAEEAERDKLTAEIREEQAKPPVPCGPN